jgi:hypothetical protein
MLELLYELLDEQERQALLTHLADCSACQAALTAARQQQHLLATAARMEFPAVRFVAPQPEAAEQAVQPAPTTPAPAPAVLPINSPEPFAGKPAKWRHLRRWAIAAGLLLAIAGLGVPGYEHRRAYLDARQRAEEQEAAVADARDRMARAKQQLDEAEASRKHEIETIERTVKAAGLQLVVVGPRNMQPGAPTVFQVRTSDLNGQPASAEIVAQVADNQARDSKGLRPAEKRSSRKDKWAEAKEAKKADQGKSGDRAAEDEEARKLSELAVERVEKGLYRVTVPPSLPLQPNRQLTLLVSARRDAGARAELRETLSLTAPTYLTHLTTDKPIYQPGEVVHFRSLTLDRFSLAPAREDFRLQYALTLPTGEQRAVLVGGNSLFGEGPKGQLAPVLGPDGQPVRGVGAGSLFLPLDAPGGEYTLTVREERQRFAEQSRKFVVNRYQKPRLDKVLNFNRSSYGPGDEVQVSCRATRADTGLALADRSVRVLVQIDDKTFGADGKERAGPFNARTDTDGRALVRFKLPERIDRGQASVAVTFDDGGTIETIVRTIPVIVKKLSVEFFPEGGDLVAGLPNRVYFQVRTPLGKPADIKGRLVVNGQVQSQPIATLTDATHPGVNQGLGQFTFTPEAGRRYEVQIDSPAGITPNRVALPEVLPEGVVLTVPEGVVGPGEPIHVTVRSSRERLLMVGAYCRGRLLDSVRLEKGQTEAVLRPMHGPAVAAGGVCRVTVFEELPTGGARRDLRPVAERLIYRHPLERVDIDIRPDQRRYVPAQKVKVSLATTDEKERFKPAFVMLAIVDKSVLTMADEKTARTMPTHFLLTTEVRRPEDLEYADFLLDPHPKSAEALDLLLGTQGWRRFAEQDPAGFRRKVREEAERLGGDDQRRHQEEAERLLVMIGQASPKTVDFSKQKVREKIEKVNDAFEAKAEALVADHDKARDVVARAAADEEYLEAVALAARYRDGLDQVRRVAVPLSCALLLVVGLIFFGAALARPVARAWPHYAAVAACAVLMVLLTRLPGPGNPIEPLGASGELAELEPPVIARAEEADQVDDGDAPGAEPVQAATGAAPEAIVGGGGKGGGDKAPSRRPVSRGKSKGRAMAPPMAPGGRPPLPAPGMAVLDGALGGPKAVFTREGKAAKHLDADRMNKQLLALNVRALGLGGARFAEADRLKEEQGGRGGEAAMRGWRLRQADLMRRRGGMARDMRGESWDVPPLVVREYAHQRQPGNAPALRSDFSETLYWHPVLVLPDGKGEVSFELCDSVTTFQVTAFAHTLDGRLGAATRKIESSLPFTLSPKLPLEVTSSDRVEVPLSISNNGAEPGKVEVDLKEVTGLQLLPGGERATLEVPADSAVRRLYRLQPSLREGTAKLTFEGKSARFGADAVRGAIKVVPEGFPVTEARSDLLEGGAAVQTIELPRRWVKGTLQARVDVYPSTLADLQRGLAGLLREPHGCFEQASTSNYPNVLILDFLRESGQANPEVERTARELLARGYQKLTSYECRDSATSQKRGYEWFGGTAAPHEALTAYGLMQFRDMARVHDVDPAMLKRTHDYLLSQRDDKGGFRRNPRALDTFGRAPDHITNAYIVWGLTEGGKGDDLKAQLTTLLERARKSDDPYFLALVANSLINRGQTKDALPLLKKIESVQKGDGRLEATETSITGSRGRDLQIETTSLALLGWLRSNTPAFTGAIQKSVRWIGKQRGGHGAFGSTQSTILALKALIAYTKAHKRTVEAGELRLYVGADLVARRSFAAGATEALALEVPKAEHYLKAGSNRVRIELTGRNTFPYTLSWSYRTLTPASAAGAPVKLTTTLAKKQAREGEVVRLTVEAENVSGSHQGMAVAVVGLPGGMALPEDLKQLKEHTRVAGLSRPTLGAFEVRGRELVLYWRDLAKGEKVSVPIDLVCRVPGSYRGPASRAYLYYNADRKHWIEPLQVTINAKAE